MTKRFVMLGERNEKGRIVKNEQYGIGEFIDNLTTLRNENVFVENVKVSIFDFFNIGNLRNKIERMKDSYQRLGYSNAFIAVEDGINDLIDKDNFGKKKK